MKKTFIQLLLCLLVTFLTFSSALNNQFVNWDDTETILNNPLLRDFSLHGLKSIFTQFTTGNYHPLTNLSFAVEHHFWGFNSFVIHLNNIILHVINSALVFWFILRLTGQPITALITSLLFGIHPMHVESVAWATERKDVLYTFFYLLALICYHKRFYTLTFVLFILSLFSKIQAVTFPLSILAIDYYLQRSISIKSILQKVPYLTLSLIFLILGLIGGKLTGAYHVSENFNITDRIFLSASTFIIYIIKLIAPFQLSCFYPYPEKGDFAFIINGLISFILILFSYFIFLRYGKRNRVLIFGILFFIINIFLCLQLIPVGHAYIADRFTYLASLGIFLILATGINKVIYDPWPSISRLKLILIYFFGIYVLILSSISFLHCQVWQNGGRLWTDVINQYPNNHEAYLFRGDYFVSTGKIQKALDDYEQSINLNPNYTKTYVNRGNLYQSLKYFDLALQDYNLAIKLKPEVFKIIINRANVLSQMGNYEAALNDYQHVLTLDPNNSQIYYNRGILFHTKGEYQQSIDDFNKAKSLGIYVNDEFLQQLQEKIKP